jgi:hypothetical protein
MVGKLLRTFRTKKTHSNRISAYKWASEFRNSLNEFMNVLEKDFSPQLLLEFIKSSLIEPLGDMAQSIDSMLDSIKQNIETIKYDDSEKERKRIKLLETINRRKMSLFTKKMLQNDLFT